MKIIYSEDYNDYCILPKERLDKYRKPVVYVKFGPDAAIFSLDGSILHGSLPEKQLEKARKLVIHNRVLFYMEWMKINNPIKES